MLRSFFIKAQTEQFFFLRLDIAVIKRQNRLQILLFEDFICNAAGSILSVFKGAEQLQGFSHIDPVSSGKSLTDAVCKVIIKIRDALTAMLVVLVRLDSDTGQR